MARKSKLAKDAANSEVGMEAYLDEIDSDEVSDALETAGYEKVSNSGAYRKQAVRYESDFESMFDA